MLVGNSIHKTIKCDYIVKYEGHFQDKDYFVQYTPLTPTNREVRNVERPFLCKFISFQLYLNSCIVIILAYALV